MKETKKTIRGLLLEGEREERFLISDVAKHGCSGGTISELIYYWDINKFYEKHFEEIWDEVNELGGLVELIKDQKTQPTCYSHFNCLMVWVAVESVACKIVNERNEKVA